jgi:quercetin dioxygenase-like cupin family protein
MIRLIFYVERLFTCRSKKDVGDFVKHVHYTEVELEEPSEEGIKDLKVRWLISEKDGAKNFAMRLFEIQPGGYSPLHQHDWEHEVFILEGEGVTRDKTNEKPFKQGDVFFVPPMEWHQFVNTGENKLKLLCLIPYKKD